MSEHGNKKQSSKVETAIPTPTLERRQGDRQTITAAAEVSEAVSGARFSTRTTDLGPGGCFIDTMVPFPVGSKVQVCIREGKTQIEASGIVVYSQTGLGMGIAFDSIDHANREALERWLGSLADGQEGSEDLAAPRAPWLHPMANRKLDQTAVVRLVQLMIGKGILTEGEGASVLHDPVL